MYEDNSDDKNKTDSEISFGLAIRLSEVLLEYLLIKNLPKDKQFHRCENEEKEGNRRHMF